MLLVLLNTSFIYCQSLKIEDWKLYPVASNKDSLQKNLSDEDEWFVFKKKERVFVTNEQEKALNRMNDTLNFDYSILSLTVKMFPAGKPSIVKVSDGFLIGVYNGVFRGGLYWFSFDGKKGYQISTQKIVKIIKRGEKIFAAQDYARPNAPKGNLIEIERTSDAWTVHDYMDLPSAPVDACVNSNNEIVVLTSGPNRLVSINERNELATLITTGVWDSFLPHNIIADKNTIFIALNKGILKYNLSDDTQELLLPN
jgi:hypothetical protein